MPPPGGPRPRPRSDAVTAAVEALVDRVLGTTRPAAEPDLFVVSDRPSRTVLSTRLPVDGQPTRVFVKVHRRARAFDALRDGLRGPRGPAEAAVLRALHARGVPVPEVLHAGGRADAATDFVATRGAAGASIDDLPAAGADRRARRRAAAAVGRLLRAAHDAGWDGRDVHGGNVLVDGDRAVLLDAGTRPPGAALSERARTRALGRAAHGLGAGPREGLVALRAYLGREDVRARFRAAARACDATRRAYRRGRARRATRDGRHFETFAAGAVRGVRRRAHTPADAPDLLAAWLAGGGPAGARPMKAGGEVVAGSFAGGDGDLVVKRYAARLADRVRVPRAIRAFRRAYALEIRGIGCPRALAAAAAPDGRGLLVSERWRDGHGDAPDLLRAVEGRDGAPPRLPGLTPAARRAAFEALGRFLRRVHDAEVVHRDLKAPNLVAASDGTHVRYAIVDLDGARVARGAVPVARRARDLARLDASVGPAVSRADRVRVARGYLAAWAHLPTTLGAFARAVAAGSRAKRGPTGAPR